MQKYLSLFVAIIAVITQWPPQTTAGTTLTSVTSFDDFLKVFKRISKPTEKIRFAEAIWGEIRADYGGDLDKATALYKRFASAMDGTENSEQAQAASELLHEIRRHLIKGNAQLLANTWNGDLFPDTAAIQKFCRSLMSNYELNMVKDIYNTAIDEMYSVRSAEILAALIYNIVDPSQPASFEVMVSAELHLYWQFENNDGVNDSYLYNLAIYFYQITHSKDFLQLPADNQRRVQKAIDNMPSSLHNFFFESNFCLVNVNQSQIAFSQDSYNIDTYTRFVFVYYEPNLTPTGSQVGWTLGVSVPDVSLLNGTIDARYFLKANTTSYYMYMEQNIVAHRDAIALHRSTNVQPRNSEWRVKFLENKLVFHQNGFLMCVSDLKYDAYRIYVNGFKSYYNTETYAPCQWQATKC